jgi:hypothetical protein
MIVCILATTAPGVGIASSTDLGYDATLTVGFHSGPQSQGVLPAVVHGLAASALRTGRVNGANMDIHF